MLKLQQAPTFTGKVEIPLKGEKVAVIVCVFRWMHVKDLRAFLGKVQAAGMMNSPSMRLVQWVVRLVAHVPGLRAWAERRTIPYRTDFDFLNEILVSWEGVDMEWGPEACRRLIEQHPNAVSLILGAWCAGLAEGRLGN
jgi:hypothetical protein